MSVCKLVVAIALAGLASAASAENMVVKGESIEVYSSFSIDRSQEFTATSLPAEAVGIYGKYAVYEGTGESSPTVLAFVRRSTNLNGGLVLNTIDFRCKKENLSCNPLQELAVTVKALNPKRGVYRAIVPDIKTWFEAYGKLSESTEIINFAPLYDTGVSVSVQ